MARTFKDADARAGLFCMAETWLRMAKNDDADEVTAVQQQQQIHPKQERP